MLVSRLMTRACATAVAGALGKSCLYSINVVNSPMVPCACRRIRVVTEEDETGGHCRCGVPRPAHVVRLSKGSTPKSLLTSILSALGDPYPSDPRMATSHRCQMDQELAKFRRTKMIIFENLASDFGGEFVAGALRRLRQHGLQIVCILS
jgi:hypothetical protein